MDDPWRSAELVDAPPLHEDMERACNGLAISSTEADKILENQLALWGDAVVEDLGIHFRR